MTTFQKLVEFRATEKLRKEKSELSRDSQKSGTPCGRNNRHEHEMYTALNKSITLNDASLVAKDSPQK
jgi:hypothetical protein